MALDDVKSRLLTAFGELPTEGSGGFGQEEIGRVLQALGIDEGDIPDIFTKIDTDEDGIISHKEFVEWVFAGAEDANGANAADPEAPPEDLKDQVKRLKQHLHELREEQHVMSNYPVASGLISAPETPNIVDNMLLFLPEKAVKEINVEPNMDDKGDARKELWFGRVWELRALVAQDYSSRLLRVISQEEALSDEVKSELMEKLEDPEVKFKIAKLAACWRGAVFRKRCNLAFLDRLKFCNLRGTLIYCHGSGGCSWDNMRICRMICRLGFLVIAPDGFAYPENTAMGKLRHKDVLPLHAADDDVNYWTGDLIYSSAASGTSIYSTSASEVLKNPDEYRSLYERCYQLRRSELHFTIARLPQYIKTRGFFLGGTSEGGMTIARFDDQRYGDMVCGRFINSFSVEYCYFTPTADAGEIGGQVDVPTLNIIGTKDQYFGPEDSVAKIVVEDEVTGYGDSDLTGNAYNTFVRQGVDPALVCVLEDGVHSPCNTHDNFLRQLFDTFFSRPGDIWKLDEIWDVDPTMAVLIEPRQSSIEEDIDANVVQVFVPRMKLPQKMSLREAEAMRQVADYESKIAEQMEKEAQFVAHDQEEAKAMLDDVRAQCSTNGGSGFECKDDCHKNFYRSDRFTTVKHHRKLQRRRRE